jgi:hypothetical protein
MAHSISVAVTRIVKPCLSKKGTRTTSREIIVDLVGRQIPKIKNFLYWSLQGLKEE